MHALLRENEISGRNMFRTKREKYVQKGRKGESTRGNDIFPWNVSRRPVEALDERNGIEFGLLDEIYLPLGLSGS